MAVVSDGTRVLGLGDIGPKAGLPVMEGKALLFKYLGGVDAVPIMLTRRTGGDHQARAAHPARLWRHQPRGYRTAQVLSGAGHRCAPRCEIPVFHDDQQGTATVMLAGCINACKLVGKRIANAHIAIIGMGAANVAISG